MAYISRSLRELIFERANRQCEYCQTPQTIVVEMTIDHIVPEAAGGDTVIDNLCLACITCNARKHAHQTGSDPETGKELPLYNPCTEIWDDHFEWDEEHMLLIGRTAMGRATIQRLQMNRELVVRAREHWKRAGWKL